MSNLTLKLKQQQGFTLIELLVALGVSAVIAVLAYQSIDSMVNVKANVEEHASQTEILQRAVWWMEQDFIQLTPRPIQDELGSDLPAFQYRADTGIELSRIAQFPTPNSNGGLQRVGYVLDNSVLYRLTWPVMDRAPDTKPKKVVLLEDVSKLDVELLNASDKWVDSWPAPTQTLDELPKATRIVIEHKTLGTLSRLYMGVS
ncbi:type II secretion system minor pseudopilin GspJ [Thiomicrorhabdus sp. Kp2]|uniref:type II secretion system minor pseudopilin GspJ n=1 Tax=Thiomicrorhabdus sp. Kp2 TaxID=1123518 RepID=UPI00041DD10C|nr:type II secretion system minor pseudopilin GspJ [Thiomicrorhabdus sp. Kp2]